MRSTPHMATSGPADQADIVWVIGSAPFVHENQGAAGQLASWSAGQLVSWSAGQLVSWAAGQLASWPAGQLLSWSVSWSAGQLAS